MNKKLIEQVTNAILIANPEQMSHVAAGELAALAIDTIFDNCIVTYTYPDPEGGNFPYADLDDLVMDMDLWDDETGQEVPVFMQFEPRDPIFKVRFVDGKPERLQ